MKKVIEARHFQVAGSPGIIYRQVYYFEKFTSPKPGTFTLGVYSGIVVYGPTKYQATMNKTIEQVKKDFNERGWKVTKIH